MVLEDIYNNKKKYDNFIQNLTDFAKFSPVNSSAQRSSIRLLEVYQAFPILHLFN